MAKMTLLLAYLIGLAAAVKAAEGEPHIESVLNKVAGSDDGLLFQSSVVDTINGLNPGWVAGHNPGVHGMKWSEYIGLLGTYLSPPPNALLPWRKVHKHAVVSGLPDTFDARDKWGHCESIKEIRDQGHCGSCWAFGAVEALTDRFCIHGNESVSLSANDLLSCCGLLCGSGCNGGWPYKAWRYFMRKGVVSNQCQPYFDQEGCAHPGCSPVWPTPKCSKQCANEELWGSSKHYAQSVYIVGPEEEEIKTELFLNGPIEVDFTVFEDFSYYKSGVYKHVYGGVAGGHAVKLIGWGTENGEDYWLIANSWNPTWGMDGYFKILRGVNECGIEADAVAGMPAIKKKNAAVW